MSKTQLTSIVGSAVAAKPTMAVGLSYVAGALNGSSEITTAITSNVKGLTPEQKTAIENASNSGKDLKPAPKAENYEALFPLRTAIDPNADPNADPNDPTTSGSGSPLSTQEFIDITSSS